MKRGNSSRTNKMTIKSTNYSSHEKLVPGFRTKKQTTSVRSFDYKQASPKDYEVTPLNGRGKKRLEPNNYHLTLNEVQYGHRRLISSGSNSKRTIVPNLNSDYVVPCHRLTKCNRNSKEFDFISKVDNEPPKRKKTNPKVYTSQCFNYKQNPKRPNCLRKPRTPFEQYTTTTQIAHLPGGIKRNSSDISDDSLPLKKNYSSTSYRRKQINDYNTNVACLPGCNLNPVNHTFRKFSANKNRTSIELEKENTLANSMDNMKPYRPAGRFKNLNDGKGKKFINLEQWKKDYYGKMEKLFNHVNKGNVPPRKTYGVYKNESHFQFI